MTSLQILDEQLKLQSASPNQSTFKLRCAQAKEKQRISSMMRVTTLCNTLAGNPVKLITITDSIQDYILTDLQLNDFQSVSEVKKMLKLRPLRYKGFPQRRQQINKRQISTHSGTGTGGGNYTGYHGHVKTVPTNSKLQSQQEKQKQNQYDSVEQDNNNNINNNNQEQINNDKNMSMFTNNESQQLETFNKRPKTNDSTFKPHIFPNCRPKSSSVTSSVKNTKQPKPQQQQHQSHKRLTSRQLLEQTVGLNFNDFRRFTLMHGHKKAIIISARVHPGESNSSHVMQGFLDFILSQRNDAKLLRKYFVFKIIPMLNPDGVIYGNYRCSLLGVDLNRKWINPNRYLHPTVYYTKQLFKLTQDERKIQLYVDLHGHSRKKNAFFYGCCYKGQQNGMESAGSNNNNILGSSNINSAMGSVSSAQQRGNFNFNFNYKQGEAMTTNQQNWEMRRKNAMLKIFPLIFQQKNKVFSFDDCRFRMEKCKQSTARIVVFKEFGVMNSFTLQSTFYGPSNPKALDYRNFGGYSNNNSHKKKKKNSQMNRQSCIVEEEETSQLDNSSMAMSQRQQRNLSWSEDSQSTFSRQIKQQYPIRNFITNQYDTQQSLPRQQTNEQQYQSEQEEHKQERNDTDNQQQKPSIVISHSDDRQKGVGVVKNKSIYQDISMNSFDFRKLGYDLCHAIVSYLPYQRCAHKLAAIYQKVYNQMNECDPLPQLVLSGIRQFFSGFNVNNNQGGSSSSNANVNNNMNSLGNQFIQLKQESDFLEDVRQNILKDDRFKRRINLINDQKYKKQLHVEKLIQPIKKALARSNLVHRHIRHGIGQILPQSELFIMESGLFDQQFFIDNAQDEKNLTKPVKATAKRSFSNSTNTKQFSNHQSLHHSGTVNFDKVTSSNEIQNNIKTLPNRQLTTTTDKRFLVKQPFAQNSDEQFNLSEPDCMGIERFFKKNIETIKGSDNDSQDSESSDSEASMREFVSKKLISRNKQKRLKGLNKSRKQSNKDIINSTSQQQNTSNIQLYIDSNLPPEIKQLQQGEDSPIKPSRNVQEKSQKHLENALNVEDSLGQKLSLIKPLPLYPASTSKISENKPEQRFQILQKQQQIQNQLKSQNNIRKQVQQSKSRDIKIRNKRAFSSSSFMKSFTKSVTVQLLDSKNNNNNNVGIENIQEKNKPENLFNSPQIRTQYFNNQNKQHNTFDQKKQLKIKGQSPYNSSKQQFSQSETLTGQTQFKNYQSQIAYTDWIDHPKVKLQDRFSHRNSTMSNTKFPIIKSGQKTRQNEQDQRHPFTASSSVQNFRASSNTCSTNAFILKQQQSNISPTNNTFVRNLKISQNSNERSIPLSSSTNSSPKKKSSISPEKPTQQITSIPKLANDLLSCFKASSRVASVVKAFKNSNSGLEDSNNNNNNIILPDNQENFKEVNKFKTPKVQTNSRKGLIPTPRGNKQGIIAAQSDEQISNQNSNKKFEEQKKSSNTYVLMKDPNVQQNILLSNPNINKHINNKKAYEYARKGNVGTTTFKIGIPQGQIFSQQNSKKYLTGGKRSPKQTAKKLIGKQESDSRPRYQVYEELLFKKSKGNQRSIQQNSNLFSKNRVAGRRSSLKSNKQKDIPENPSERHSIFPPPNFSAAQQKDQNFYLKEFAEQFRRNRAISTATGGFYQQQNNNNRGRSSEGSVKRFSRVPSATPNAIRRSGDQRKSQIIHQQQINQKSNICNNQILQKQQSRHQFTLQQDECLDKYGYQMKTASLQNTSNKKLSHSGRNQTNNQVLFPQQQQQQQQQKQQSSAYGVGTNEIARKQLISRQKMHAQFGKNANIQQNAMRGRDPCAQPPHLGGGFKNKSSSQHPIISVNALVGKKGGGGGFEPLNHKQSSNFHKKKGGKSVAQKIIPLLRQINNNKNSTATDFANKNFKS